MEADRGSDRGGQFFVSVGVDLAKNTAKMGAYAMSKGAIRAGPFLAIRCGCQDVSIDADNPQYDKFAVRT